MTTVDEKFEGPFDDKPDDDWPRPAYPTGVLSGEAIRRCRESGLTGREFDVPAVPSLVLTGDSHTAFTAFGDVCSRLEAHQKAGAALMEEYKARLAKLSEVAARSVR